MNHINIFAITILLLTIGCDNDSVGTVNGTKAGRSTITTKFVNNRGVGFSFEKGDTVIISSSSTFKHDIDVAVQQDDTGKVLGVFISGRISQPAFKLKYSSSVSDSARLYFNNLINFSDSTYSLLAIPVVANQVWIVKTNENTFAKILIVSTTAYVDNSTPPNATPYGEVTFDWVYQPSGERKF